jgi:hypothetical protein
MFTGEQIQANRQEWGITLRQILLKHGLTLIGTGVGGATVDDVRVSALKIDLSVIVPDRASKKVTNGIHLQIKQSFDAAMKELGADHPLARVPKDIFIHMRRPSLLGGRPSPTRPASAPTRG